MAYRGDGDYRDYHNRRLLVDVSSVEPSSLSTILDADKNPHMYSDYSFEVVNSTGWRVIDMLADYLPMFDCRPELFTRVTFDDRTALLFEYKIHSLSNYLYGTTELYWIILLFNEIDDNSDLTRVFLKEKGILALNSDGIGLLNEILSLRDRMKDAYSIDKLFEAYEG